MKALPAALALLCALSVPAAAQSDAQHMLDAIFQSFDENRDGAIGADEANRFIDKTFTEMDRFHTGRIGRDAWMHFSFGLADLAADQGRSDAYDRAKYKIFRRWDRSGVGSLSPEDYRAGVIGEARAAAGGKSDGKIDGKIDLAAFKRARFVRELMRSLHH